MPEMRGCVEYIFTPLSGMNILDSVDVVSCPEGEVAVAASPERLVSLLELLEFHAGVFVLLTHILGEIRRFLDTHNSADLKKLDLGGFLDRQLKSMREELIKLGLEVST